MLTACASQTPVAAQRTPSTLQSMGDVVGDLDTDLDPSIPAAYRRAVEAAQIEGNALYREDRAAWLATDALKAHGGTDYFKAAGAKMAPCMGGRPEIEYLDAVE